MRRAWAIALLSLAIASSARSQEQCAVAKDLVIRALELVSAQPKTEDLESGLQLLKHAIQVCNESGDAWYYRSLFEQQLKRASLATYSMKKAQTLGSDALKQAANPFQLSTPLSRSVDVFDPLGPGPKLPAHGPLLQGSAISPDVTDKWALVVGISNFQERKLRLLFTRNDADSFAELLKDPKYGRFRPDHVRVLEDDQATTVQIRAGLNWLARMAGPEDLAVIYISTHGSGRELDIAAANYLITHDTDVHSYDGLYSTALPMVEISNVIRTRLRARKAAVFLDTCHSGGAIAQTVTVSASLSPLMLEHIREGTGRAIVTASQQEENSYENTKLGHGIFTYYLLAALRQQEGRMPLDKVYESLSANVIQAAAAQGRKQHPVLSRSEQQSVVVIGIPPKMAGVPVR